MTSLHIEYWNGGKNVWYLSSLVIGVLGVIFLTKDRLAWEKPDKFM
jgi:hypothetical protein